MIALKSNNGTVQKQTSSSSDRRQSRYRATCPCCKQRIEAGHWVVPIHSGGERPRWKHEDCNNVPAAAVAVTAEAADLEARQAVEELTSQVRELSAQLADLERNAPRNLVVKVADREPVELTGNVHPALEEVLELLAAGEAVFLPGPSGCGKSHLAHQAAEAMGLKFAAISCSAGMSESQLLGRAIPRGKSGQFEFCTTQFLDCYENGGLFLGDEIDAADPNVLLVVNSALANGFLSVPARHENPIAKRHPDFKCIAAANTFGRGADRVYVGRNPIDLATLDRFLIGTVPMDYDRELEAKLWLAYCEDLEVLHQLWSIRVKLGENRMERILSTRFIIAAAKALTRGRDFDYIFAKLTAGWRADEVAKVRP